MKDNTIGRYLSVDDAAAYVGVSRRTLERAVRDGIIHAVRNPLTRRRQFHLRDLDAMMSQYDRDDGR